MFRDKPTTLAELWLDPERTYELSEADRFALPGVSVGMRCNIDQYKLLKGLDGKQKPDWDRLRNELRVLDTEDANNDDRPPTVWLQGADLRIAHIEGAELYEAHLEGAILWDAHLEGATLAFAHLEGAILDDAHLEGADLKSARLEEADLHSAHLEGTDLFLAHLERADLTHAHLEGADLCCVYLEGATLSFASVNGGTIVDGCHIDRKTNFTGVGLGACRIDPGLKQTLEYNIRRKRWQRWYTHGPWWKRAAKQLVRPFWWVSDYGRSTGRIGLWFLGFSVAFAAVYFLCGLILPPGIVDGLFTYESAGQVHTIGNHWLIAWRALYFSVVTMTTLGFGDIAAYPLSWAGHGLLMLQVILGYVLLGALVCRLAILFQAGGPAAKFSKTPKPKPEETGEADE